MHTKFISITIIITIIIESNIGRRNWFACYTLKQIEIKNIDKNISR